jgi:hypothetical protein
MNDQEVKRQMELMDAKKAARTALEKWSRWFDLDTVPTDEQAAEGERLINEYTRLYNEVSIMTSGPKLPEGGDIAIKNARSVLEMRQ